MVNLAPSNKRVSSLATTTLTSRKSICSSIKNAFKRSKIAAPITDEKDDNNDYIKVCGGPPRVVLLIYLYRRAIGVSGLLCSLSVTMIPVIVVVILEMDSGKTEKITKPSSQTAPF